MNRVLAASFAFPALCTRPCSEAKGMFTEAALNSPTMAGYCAAVRIRTCDDKACLLVLRRVQSHDLTVVAMHYKVDPARTCVCVFKSTTANRTISKPMMDTLPGMMASLSWWCLM